MAKVVEAGPFGGSGDDIVDMGAADRLPEIKIRSGIAAKVVKVGPFGGSFGDMFDMGAADQLLEIKIRSGIAVDAIIITYLVNGRIETRRFGGEGGEESLQKKFRPGEFLIEISGSSNHHGLISSLNSRTNLTQMYHMFQRKTRLFLFLW
ncbi:uncharacterized protein [Elaeis guineensis]|uniref:uncharacterized protein isoform X2 n=1 Tax=Elaeis guineensis var. tenera TaxID=51953 RepID=UPI003C6D6D9C